MSRSIENFLYGNRGVHAVTGIAMLPEVIRLRLAPWEDQENLIEAVFSNARITSIEVYADDAEDFNLPWDILGMDSYELDGRRWRFVLHCAGIEYGFEAEWPTLTDGPFLASNQSQANMLSKPDDGQ